MKVKSKSIRIPYNNRNVNYYTIIGILLLFTIVFTFVPTPPRLIHGLIMLIIPVSMVLFTRGIEIDLNQKKFRTYVFFYIYFHKDWQSLDGYTHVGLRPVTMLHPSASPAAVPGMAIDRLEEGAIETELYLWHKQKNKIVLKRGKAKRLKTLAAYLSTQLKLELHLHPRFQTK